MTQKAQELDLLSEKNPYLIKSIAICNCTDIPQ
jgi:hypothetical protein